MSQGSSGLSICTVPGAVLVGLLALSGCRVDHAEEVATYARVLDIEQMPSYPELGEPLGLRQAMLLANRENERLAIEGESFLRTVISRRRTLANFLPTVELTPSYALREDVGGGDSNGGTGNGATGGGGGDSDQFNAPLDLSINLFNGFRDVNAYWRDTYQIEAERNDLLALQEELLLDVAQAFFQVLRSEATVRVLEASLETQAERLREARGRVQAGLASPLTEAQIAAQESATRSQLIAARRDVLQARAALALLVAVPVAEAELADDPSEALPETIPPLETMINVAFDSRSELAAAAAAIAAARQQVEVAFGQYYPSVSLQLTTFLYRESQPTDRDWEAFLSANIPIFAAGRIRADVREAWSFWREALLLRSLMEREVVTQVRQSYAAVEASDLRLAEARVQVTAAEQALRQAEENYRVGIATNLDRVQAQEDLLEAQLLLETERFDRQIFRLDLLRATGQLREWLAEGTLPVVSGPSTAPATTQATDNGQSTTDNGPTQ